MGNAIRSQVGLETFFGGGRAGGVLASVMGTDADIAKVVGHVEAWICLDCSLENTIASLHERTEP